MTWNTLPTSDTIRLDVSPRYAHDQRYEDLKVCLQLDGYLIEDHQLRKTEPELEGGVPVEDDLSREIDSCSLADAREVARLLENSAVSFRRTPPDLNGTLTNARVALQTLATSISAFYESSQPSGFDDKKWGQVLAHLRTSGFVTEEEEKGLGGVFTFVSPGAHAPVGLSEVETARLGRSLAVSMCYFLVKQFNAKHPQSAW